ncbi:MAG: hypothetical protein BCS36_01005 [Desulfovibrio sp. MES5]|nr:MAG: hypothetical protein BCS36_01005 [Desulfovibrio sp. MES5]
MGPQQVYAATAAATGCQRLLRVKLRPDQIIFEMRSISKLSFCRNMQFAVEFTPRCGDLHARAALEHVHFFKASML